MNIEGNEWELATLKFANGDPVPRTAALPSFEKAKRAFARAGGRAPLGRDGQPMLWSEHDGWHERSGVSRATHRARGRPIAELEARQRFIGYQIRQDRLSATINEERDLLRSASLMAWHWAKMFGHGLMAQPSFDSPKDVLVGWRLARRGYDTPPRWFLKETWGTAAHAFETFMREHYAPSRDGLSRRPSSGPRATTC